MSEQNSEPKIMQFKPKKIENPTPIEKNGLDVKSFKPQQFRQTQAQDYEKVRNEFGSFASTDPKTNANFKLQDETSRLLGVDKEEKGHIAGLVQSEVELRVSQIRNRAYQEGLQQGIQDGKTEAEMQFNELNRPIYEKFCGVIENLENLKNELYLANEKVLVNLIFQISKQVILRELKSDAGYIKRLSAQIVEQVGAKDHVRIKMNSADYQSMESIRDFLKGQFPDLKNIQFDVDDSLEWGGCRVETDLSRIDASVMNQLNAIESTLSKP